MKTALEMKRATLANRRDDDKQTRRLLTSWLEHQVADVIDTAVANRRFSTYIRIPIFMDGQYDYVQSYLEDHGYQVKIQSEYVNISWLNA